MALRICGLVRAMCMCRKCQLSAIFQPKFSTTRQWPPVHTARILASSLIVISARHGTTIKRRTISHQVANQPLLQCAYIFVDIDRASHSKVAIHRFCKSLSVAVRAISVQPWCVPSDTCVPHLIHTSPSVFASPTSHLHIPPVPSPKTPPPNT